MTRWRDFGRSRSKNCAADQESEDPERKETYARRLDYMRSLEMAVIVSEKPEEEEKVRHAEVTINAPGSNEQVGMNTATTWNSHCKDPGDLCSMVFGFAPCGLQARRSHCLNV